MQLSLGNLEHARNSLKGDSRRSIAASLEDLKMPRAHKSGYFLEFMTQKIETNVCYNILNRTKTHCRYEGRQWQNWFQTILNYPCGF